METVVYFSAKSIKVLQGSYNKSKFVIENHFIDNTPEGAVMNGRILDEAAMVEAFVDIKQKYISFKNTVVVLDSNRVVLKASVLPKSKPAQTKVMARNQLIDKNIFGDNYIYDYLVLETDYKEKNHNLVLSCAVDKEIVDGYISLFEKADIKLARMDISISSVIKLTSIFPNFDRENCIICIVDHYFVNIIHFLKTGGLFTSRKRIEAQEGSSAYYVEVVDKIQEYTSFKKAEVHSSESTSFVIYIFDANTYTQEGYLRVVDTPDFANDFKIIGLHNACGNQNALPDNIDSFIYQLGMLM